MARGGKSAIERDDIHYLDDASAAVLLATPWKSRVLIWVVLAFLLTAITWAALAHVEVVTRGTGEVVPSTRLQTVQNLEGGIVRDIFVSEGDIVEQGQPLVRIDDTRAGADLAERESTLSGLQAQIAQYDAELDSVTIEHSAEQWLDQVSISETSPALDSEFREAHPSLAQGAIAAYRERLRGLQAQLSQAREQITQRQQELRELQAKVESLNRSYQLSRQELSITAPLVKEGVVSRVDLLQIQRQVNDLRGELESTRLAIPSKRSELDEAISKRVDVAQQFRVRSADALSEARARLDSLRQGRSSLLDRVDRTLVTSPVHGTVRSININTIGGVVEPGQSLMEIVPIEDQLLVEAKVQPKDIGFLRPGQPATVKFSAYDFTIYGGLKGTVERISPDTVQDEEGNSYYVVRLRTERNHLGAESDPLPIIPGMQATADIITGDQTILQYLLKPILRAQQGALRER
ncbi:HlyD family type I secretion periplasmic adaptor subunit [Larsenimonas suaedae]|uniref:Membrane fusion protein (MFP) family protein n=1 Tax=Larsenimonas suaedae TaxID=1851019 RepID=A0ABU1GU95_9GAMM|nr:HlyD family type I secretion periplasmic adaptor subunit [Larsenimonas suaedae]MCM2972052.1 HlyD family type I secretion periplasmic adaptor subunit [Larsenimonas suaedae]MDR5895605.1 HlyD family type I secretion periplasmic adaptor subunit [Larsenimonas suaedae]